MNHTCCERDHRLLSYYYTVVVSYHHFTVLSYMIILLLVLTDLLLCCPVLLAFDRNPRITASVLRILYASVLRIYPSHNLNTSTTEYWYLVFTYNIPALARTWYVLAALLLLYYCEQPN